MSIHTYKAAAPLGLALLGAATLSACAPYTTMGTPAARADISTSAGVRTGEALVYQRGSDLTVTIAVTGMAAGTYGTHMHMVGRCEGPKFTSAGAHWNPMGRQHGMENALGPHSGDLPNLVVSSAGTGTVTFTIPAQSVVGTGGLIDADGGAIVIHAAPDDMRTDPSGNSGDRIACGVFRQM